MFSYPYEILKKLAEDSIPELREVEFYLQQDSTTDKNGSLLASPALYFEFDPVGDLVLHGNKAQSMEVEVKIYLLTENVIDNGKRMKKDSPLDHMRIYDKINKTFQGFGSKLSYLPEFAALVNTIQDQRVLTSLNRVDTESPHQPRKGMMKSIQTFSTIIYDHSACKKYSKHPVPIDIDVEFEIPELELDGIFDDTFDDTFE